MNNKVKRLLVSSMLFLLVLYSLSACSPEIISQAKAKEAGLELINLAFDTNETDADVTYIENRQMDSEDETLRSEEEDISRVYEVTIKSEDDTEYLYYAEVNAESGLAYYASKSEILLTPLNQDQMNEATRLNGLIKEDDIYLNLLKDSQIGAFSYEWVESRFHRDITLLETLDIGTYSDNVMYPRISIGYYIIFVDGAVYEVYLSWPTMEVLSIQILSQSVS